MQRHYPVVIAGGGTAGLTVAAQLVNVLDPSCIALIEPNDRHFYQPLWTLVGGGVFPKEESMRDEAEFIPAGVTWIQEYVSAFDPDQNRVALKNGDALTYDYLVVALGIQIDWDKIKGLREALAERNGVCSNYSYETVDRTWENIRSFRGGVAVFTQPSTPIKCGGAPQKIAYLADDHFRRAGVRSRSAIKFFSGTGGIFSVKKYADALTAVCRRKGIETHFQYELVEINHRQKEAVFQSLASGEHVSVRYDMIHVTPPM
ncbi:MAG: NAD(P)/FAD-dependent oxidoreductase, partial [Roseiflexus sp.]